ncbi:hypothetical protein BpHYR1_023514 [Brachionus plicatilis]|uniref:Uncharacterized protein n=1 Tax=Brachionus plicatilis TaxID=10195 RepID=A0A3M7Q042_BRAPC|nr:hypothetical protein BpHYR1_023514 [Brachionus plicatilis]
MTYQELYFRDMSINSDNYLKYYSIFLILKIRKTINNYVNFGKMIVRSNSQAIQEESIQKIMGIF